ncbi:MAG: hypothetical protein WCW93_00305 [Candidatus Paceibacterota bacterium]
MINDQLLSYVKQQLSLNVGREVITSNLKSQGWTDDDVNEAFRAIMPVSVPTSVPTPLVVSCVNPNLTQIQTNFSNTTHIKSKKIFFIVIIILILLCMAGGGAYAYYSGVFVSLPKLVSEAIDKTRVVNSANYDTTVSIDFSEVKSAATLLPVGLSSNKVIFTTKGSYDISDKNNLKSSMILSIDGGDVSIAAEFRMLNDTLYGALTKVPSAVTLFLPMISSYENKWFSVPFKSTNGQAVDNPIASFSNIDISVVDKITPEQEERLYQMTRDASFIKVVKRFSPETITGEMSYHFTFDLDREGISSYLQSLKDYINSVGKNDSSLSAFDPTSFDKELDNLKDFTGEIWIGRNDKLLHKIVLNFGIQLDPTKNEQVKVSIVGIMSGWNQPVSITAPAESTPFADLISTLFNPSQLPVKEIQKKSIKK